MFEALLSMPEIAAAILQLVVQFPAIVLLAGLVYRMDQRMLELNRNLSESRREEAAVHAAIAAELDIALPHPSPELNHGRA